MTISIEKVGRRYYFVGNTFSIKGKLKDAGASYDADRRQWWTGKKEVAERFSGEVKESAKSEDAGLDTKVVGRAQYKGKSYYVIWHGHTRSGDYAAKLCFRDGTKEFWAKETDQLRITKEYQDPRSIRSLQDFARQAKEGEKDGSSGSCAECGRYATQMVSMPDSSGIVSHICRTCASQTTQWERSYQ